MTTIPNINGFEDGFWYKFRSAGDNTVIQLDSRTGNKLICSPENKEYDDLQIFQAIRLPNGKYRIVGKCKKSPDVCQVWEYLPHRELLLLRKQSPIDKFTQNWTSEHVQGYNALYLIQSSSTSDTFKCLRNMGPGTQVQLVSKACGGGSIEGDNFARWYLELQVDICPLVVSLPSVSTSILPIPPAVSLPIVPPIPISVVDGFQDGNWYKFRSVGDDNVIQVSVTVEGKKELVCAPDSKVTSASLPAFDLSRFRVTILSNGKFKISIPTQNTTVDVSAAWDLAKPQEGMLLLSLSPKVTTETEELVFSQQWTALKISNGTPSQFLIQPNPSPEAIEADSHKCLRNMGNGKQMQLFNQSDECVGDSYVRWILELQENITGVVTLPILPVVTVDHVPVHLQKSETPTLTPSESPIPMDTQK